MRFLVIDDNPYDRELVIRGLQRFFTDATYVEIIDNSTFEEALLTPDYMMVFTDYQLKWTNGLEVLKAIRQLSSDLPVIMITDTGSEEIATEALKNGLNDYLIKSHLARLPIAVQECLDKMRLQKEHRQLEAQLQKAQRMESLGLLVSGIAHDFNDILAEVQGYARQGMASLSLQHPLHENLQHIYSSAERGAHMTRQLLSFARGIPLDPKSLSLNQIIDSLDESLQRLIGSNIQIEIACDAALPTIYADQSQLEQILVNLCINARDAMPDGGTLSIQTRNVRITPDMQTQAEISPGTYALLIVSDTGIGMDEQVQARLFEPFFTTKEIGQGMGLGLAVVYGIMKQHHGSIRLKSAPDQGTSFSLYFPVAEVKPAGGEHAEYSTAQTLAGVETLLVVEDDQDIQILIAEFLRSCGYEVLVGDDGEEGMAILEQHAATISLVIADIVMPKMKGREFQEQIRKQYPDTKVLIMSGYQEIDLKRRELLDSSSAFLQKPFNLDELEGKIHKLLEKS